MREITITANDSGRRLDRFLRKYLREASLSEIYRIIRKDLKVNGSRKNESYSLAEGDVLTFYVPDGTLDRMTAGGQGKTAVRHKAKKQFRIIYEDDNILVADKPFGLLTHGDSHEKKNHLANQVRDYLIEKGDFDPSHERVFAPAPANRLDRNTTGLVLFGKNSAALKALNAMIREDMADKFYMTIVHGTLAEDATLTGTLTKDEQHNRVSIGAEDGRNITTVVHPVRQLTFGKGNEATLVEVRLVTGRPHQIRAHLASIGHPVIGDAKYALAEYRSANEWFSRNHKLTTQLLHACRLVINDAPDVLGYLKGREFSAPLPQTFGRILGSMEPQRSSSN